MATYSHHITVADPGFLRGGARQPQRECANLLFCKKCNRIKKQECIPVGCVPSAGVAVSRGEGAGPGGVYLVLGGCTWFQGGCTWSGGYLVLGVCSGGCTYPGGYLVWGCTWSRGVCSSGVYLVPGGWVSAPRGVYLVRYSPPVDRQTPVKT